MVVFTLLSLYFSFISAFLSLSLCFSLFSPTISPGAGQCVLRHRVGLLGLRGDDGVEDVQDGDVTVGDLELLLHVPVDQFKVGQVALVGFFPEEELVVQFLY